MLKIKKIIKLPALTAGFAGLGWGAFELTRPAYGGPAGVTSGKAYAPAWDRYVSFDIWYPASPGGKAVTVDGSDR